MKNKRLSFGYEDTDQKIEVDIYGLIFEIDKKNIINKDIKNIEENEDYVEKEIKDIIGENSIEKINDKRLKEFEVIINELSDELRVKESKKKFLSDMEKEKEGYSRAVKAILLECEKQSNLNQGVEGVLANLITVPKEYQVAIEMVLGGALQNIVTENEETAKNRELYEFLQSNNKSHYLQSPEWARVKTNWKHEMLVVKNNEKIIGTMSVLLKKVPLFNSYMMYAPRGFICNSDNKEALQKLTEEVKKTEKKYNAFVFDLKDFNNSSWLLSFISSL